MLSKRAYPVTDTKDYDIKADSVRFQGRLSDELKRAVSNTIDAFFSVETRGQLFDSAASSIERAATDITKTVFKK